METVDGPVSHLSFGLVFFSACACVCVCVFGSLEIRSSFRCVHTVVACACVWRSPRLALWSTGTEKPAATGFFLFFFKKEEKDRMAARGAGRGGGGGLCGVGGGHQSFSTWLNGDLCLNWTWDTSSLSHRCASFSCMMHNLHANVNKLNKHCMHAGLLLQLPCRPRIGTHTRAVYLRWLKEAVDLESSVSVATNTVGAKQSSAMDIPKIRSDRRLLGPVWWRSCWSSLVLCSEKKSH